MCRRARCSSCGGAEVLITVLTVLLYLVVAVLVTYTARHYLFTLNRLFGRPRERCVDVTSAVLRETVVLIPCHNEENVIAGSLDALLANDYPHDRLTIIPI